METFSHDENYESIKELMKKVTIYRMIKNESFLSKLKDL